MLQQVEKMGENADVKYFELEIAFKQNHRE